MTKTKVEKMNEKVKEYRKQIADEFIKSLEEKPLLWKQEWTSGARQRNGITGRGYSGLNNLWLSHLGAVKGYKDPRWLTFKQIKTAGYHLKKDSKGAKIEFWSFYYPKNRVKITPDEAEELRREGETVVPIATYYVVFNAELVEGIEPFKLTANPEVKYDNIIDTISQSMKVKIHYGGGNAFYSPLEDSVTLPPPESFESQEGFTATALHELTHATGAKHRLNREQGFFGSEEYAKEELVAEIASCFLNNELYPGSEPPAMRDNHKAYVQSWIKSIRDKPETLFAAIKNAEKASDYIEKAAGIEPQRSVNKEKQAEPAKEPDKPGEGQPHIARASFVESAELSGKACAAEESWEYEL